MDTFPVVLHVYDLSDLNWQGSVLSLKGALAHRLAIEVHGSEWAFSCLGGVCCEPPSHVNHIIVPLGHTTVAKDKFYLLIEDMHSEWPEQRFDVFNRNCGHFCDALREKLGLDVGLWSRRVERALDGKMFTGGSHIGRVDTYSATCEVRNVVQSRHDVFSGAVVCVIARSSVPVVLLVYNLSLGNALLRKFGTGVFHTTIHVHGLEWSYGYCPDKTGIFSAHPPAAPAFKEAVLMGFTTLSSYDIVLLTDRLELEWPGREYHLLRKNCSHFCNHLCRELGCKEIPMWVSSLAVAGEAVIDGIDTVSGRREMEAIVSAARASPLWVF